MEIRKAAEQHIIELESKRKTDLRILRGLQDRYIFASARWRDVWMETDGEAFESEENKALRTKAYDEFAAAEQAYLNLKKNIEKYSLWLGNHIYMNRHGYTDMHPYEVITIVTPKKMIIREMLATETEESKKRRKETFVPTGFIGITDNDVQEWDIRSQDTSDFDFAVRLHGDGYWYDTNGNRYTMSDKPIKFYDFNF
jgi:hypothetical protein